MAYHQLETGYELPVSQYQLDKSKVASYLMAVEDTSRLYQDSGLVPSMAIAAWAMAAFSEHISLPPGTIHVSQELEFLGTVSVGDTIFNHARVSQQQSRGKFQFLTIELDVRNQRQETVLAGKASFILPEDKQNEGQ